MFCRTKNHLPLSWMVYTPLIVTLTISNNPGLTDSQHMTSLNYQRQYNFDDGRLAKAVQIKGNAVFKAKEFGLIPVHVDTLGPWVFVNLGESTTGTLFSSFFSFFFLF